LSFIASINRPSRTGASQRSKEEDCHELSSH
jgi:hypothetical protein